MLKCRCIKPCLNWKVGDYPSLLVIGNKYYIDGYIISYSDFIEYFERLSVDEQREYNNDSW